MSMPLDLEGLCMYWCLRGSHGIHMRMRSCTPSANESIAHILSHATLKYHTTAFALLLLIMREPLPVFVVGVLRYMKANLQGNLLVVYLGLMFLWHLTEMFLCNQLD